MKHLHCLRDMAEGGNMLIQDSLSAAVGGASESKRLDNLDCLGFWGIKKKSEWIFIIVGWLCSHTAETYLYANTT